jgi:hypothetical protein
VSTMPTSDIRKRLWVASAMARCKEASHISNSSKSVAFSHRSKQCSVVQERNDATARRSPT